jgi:serine/threonine protein kinase
MTMSADSKNVCDSLADQLSSFDDRLHATANDVDMLADIQNGIGRLLSESGNSEAEIRHVLQERYDAGALRKETFQLVKSMLDRYSTENMPTSPTEEDVALPPRQAPIAPPPFDNEPQGEDQFGATTVIPTELMPDLSAEPPVQVGSLLRDRFLLQEKISGGSMGVVYKAMDRRLAEAGSKDHWVAVKVLSPKLAKNGQALRALQQEAAKGRCLVHPNIVQFVDLDRDDDLYFLIMEWLEGRTLADILDSKDASVIDDKAAFRITRQIGDALDYAHSRGIVHADIKPGNIMIVPNGDAKLFDFGVARVRQKHSEAEFDPGVLGALTPAYSSMQVLTGEEPVAADDVFSLSCLLYRLLAGYRVFGPRNAAEASQEGMKPQRLKGLNDSQWRALKKGLSYSRVTRFSTVREFIDALDEIQDEPFRVEEPDRFVEARDHSGIGKWIVAILLLAGLAAVAGNQYGYLTPLIERFTTAETTTTRIIENDTPTIEAPEIVLPASEPESISEPDPEPAPETELTIAVDESPPAESKVAEQPQTVELPPAIEQMLVEKAPVVGPDPMLVDFSTLPPPTEIISFSPGRGSVKPVNIAIREDSANVIIDFVRGSSLSVPMTLRLEEVGFSGNRSPWGAGQYALSNSGLIHFPAGQARGRVSLTMASDPLREADQQSTLRLRDAEFADSEFAIINVSLEDDDQRAFESRLPANTIAFAVSQTSVRESDPAVQIDLVRFNPDNSRVDVSFFVNDISADDGQDYFGPGGHSISFGPGQRSARLLVPLVQDADVEGDEAFVVGLNSGTNGGVAGVNQRIVITIRDDDLRTP